MKFDNNEKKSKFRSLLAEEHEWPGPYQFKFIVPSGQLSILKAMFDENVDFQLKPSSAGNYTSLTIEIHLNGPDEVIAIYERVSVIKGVISL